MKVRCNCLHKAKNYKVTLLKLNLYLISLWILLFLIIVLKIDICAMRDAFNNKDFLYLLKTNYTVLICIVLLLFGVIGYMIFKDGLKNTTNLPVKVTECESVNYENLSFLATYIIPLVCFPMKDCRDILVLFAVIAVIGCIFIRTNLYYSNPTLVLAGFNVYKIKTESSTGLDSGILIIRGKIDRDDYIRYMLLSDNVYYGRKQKNERK